MDEDVARWVLEFLLRQPIEDCIINSLLSVLPISNSDSRLKKTLLLRRIESELSNASVCENILEFLEIMEEIDHREGKPAPESMKAAYCAVAVDCTVRFMEENVQKNADGKYFEAVKRIWLMRVSQMKNRENVALSGLVSEKLMKWREDIEAAMWDSDVCERILMKNTRNEALKAIRVYLAEALEDLGPSFLELAAQAMSNTRGNSLGSAVVDNAGNGMENAGNPCRELIVYNAAAVHGGSDIGAGLNRGGLRGPVVDEPAVVGEKDGDQQRGLTVNETVVADAEAQKGKGQTGHKHVVPRGRRFKTLAGRSRGVKIVDPEADEVDKDKCINYRDLIPTPDVHRVQEALKSSSEELGKVVKDPLPDALRMAQTVLARMGREKTNGAAVTENLNGRGHVPSSSMDNAAKKMQIKDNATKYVPGAEGNCSHQNGRNQNNPPGTGFMDRNPTAHTYEWNDSIENSDGGPPDRLHLSSPNRGTVSPLKTYQDVKFSARRKRKRWSPLEEDTLRQGVKKFGVGNWTLILKSYREIFEGRTDVDLKDKWRNLIRPYGGR
ncbi:hypothetical protein Ancab_024517 [Ancistrocladus abbreviatus]